MAQKHGYGGYKCKKKFLNIKISSGDLNYVPHSIEMVYSHLVMLN
jgi:hypothetical protein